MAFTVISAARLPLLPPTRAGPLTTLQTSRNAADRPVAPPNRAFDAGLRPRPFPDETASLLPGLLAATRTGLPPASDDELTNTKIHHGLTSRCHLLLCWAHESPRLVIGNSRIRPLPVSVAMSPCSRDPARHGGRWPVSDRQDRSIGHAAGTGGREACTRLGRNRGPRSADALAAVEVLPAFRASR